MTDATDQAPTPDAGVPTRRTLLAAFEDCDRPADPVRALAGLDELARLLDRRTRWPWRLMPWLEDGTFRAARIGLRARAAVHALPRDDRPGTLSEVHATLRSYRVPGHGRIAVRIDAADLSALHPRDASATIVAHAADAIRDAIAGPDPRTLTAGLAALASNLGGAGTDKERHVKGWTLPTPFSLPALYRGGQIFDFDVPDDPDLPRCVLVMIRALHHAEGPGFDVALSPLFVSAHHAGDVVGALRDAAAIQSAGRRP